MLNRKAKGVLRLLKMLAELSLYFALSCGFAYGALRQGWPPEILAVSVIISGGWILLSEQED